MTPKKGTEQFSCNASLYRFVYRGTTSIMAALLLCVCFFVASVDPVFASEEEVESTNVIKAENIEDITPPPTDEDENDSVAATEEEVEDNDENFDTTEVEEGEDNVEEVETAVESSDEEMTEDTEETDVEEVSDTEGEVENEVGESTGTSTEAVVETGDVEEEVATSTEEAEVEQGGGSGGGGDDTSDSESGEDDLNTNDDDTTEDDVESESEGESGDPESEQAETDTATSTATSTPEVSLERVDTVTNQDNFYQFSRDECVRVADGSFYCGAEQQDSDSEVTAVNSLFAAPDADGDLEIYLRYEGEVQQITFNQTEDNAPYFDAKSNTIVWHSLINDRYQIVSYDLNNGEETVITATGVNNMEPSRFGTMTAWQRWVGNSWEIILFDGKTEKQVSESGRHDVAPLVYETFVLWNTTAEDGTQRIVMYDMETGQRELIEDTEGAAVQNPRMVLLYETTLPSGDIVTKGFDLESRTVVPLSAQPTEVPTKIPSSDQTGETRALIQEKQTGRQNDIVHASTTPTGNATSTNPLPTVSTSTVTNIDEPVATSSIQTATSSEPSFSGNTSGVIATSTTQAEDLVVPKYTPATTTEAEVVAEDHIEDLVIPPSVPKDPE